MSNRSLVLGGIAVSILGIVGVGIARADSAVGVCAFTGSTPPYQYTVVNQSDLQTYQLSHLHDIYNVAGSNDCPTSIVAVKGGEEVTPTPTPTPSATPTATPSRAGSVLATSTSLPAQLPDTGAGLSTLIGLPAVAAAGGAYIRARMNRR